MSVVARQVAGLYRELGKEILSASSRSSMVENLPANPIALPEFSVEPESRRPCSLRFRWERGSADELPQGPGHAYVESSHSLANMPEASRQGIEHVSSCSRSGIPLQTHQMTGVSTIGT